METSLHRQLKEFYAAQGARLEVCLGSYRIDVVCGEELIEIQHGSLSAIRRKVYHLLKEYRVLVVKPVILRKELVKQQVRGGMILGKRVSPKRGRVADIFDELIYFTGIFPHVNLALEVPTVDVEEWRYPGQGRRWRRRQNDYQIDDQKLVRVHGVQRFKTIGDLLKLLPSGLPDPFHTGHLAARMAIPRSTAQRMAYCLRRMGGLNEVGKQGNARLYTVPKEWSAVA